MNYIIILLTGLVGSFLLSYAFYKFLSKDFQSNFKRQPYEYCLPMSTVFFCLSSLIITVLIKVIDKDAVPPFYIMFAGLFAVIPYGVFSFINYLKYRKTLPDEYCNRLLSDPKYPIDPQFLAEIKTELLSSLRKKPKIYEYSDDFMLNIRGRNYKIYTDQDYRMFVLGKEMHHSSNKNFYIGFIQIELMNKMYSLTKVLEVFDINSPLNITDDEANLIEMMVI